MGIALLGIDDDGFGLMDQALKCSYFTLSLISLLLFPLREPRVHFIEPAFLLQGEVQFVPQFVGLPVSG